MGEQRSPTTRWSSRGSQTKILSPISPRPARPARPAICLYFAREIKSRPTYGERRMTRRAGRLTPAASVDVQQMQHNTPLRNAFSISCRSSEVSPEWWYATPNGIVYRRIGHRAPSCCKLPKRSCLSARRCSNSVRNTTRHTSFATFSQFFFDAQNTKHEPLGTTSITRPAKRSGSIFAISGGY